MNLVVSCIVIVGGGTVGRLGGPRRTRAVAAGLPTDRIDPAPEEQFA